LGILHSLGYLGDLGILGYLGVLGNIGFLRSGSAKYIYDCKILLARHFHFGGSRRSRQLG